MTPEDNADLFETVKQVTSKIENIADAELLAIHNGKESGQEIPHVHVHIIPRRKGDSAGPLHSMFKNRPTLSDQEFNELLKQIKG